MLPRCNLAPMQTMSDGPARTDRRTPSRRILSRRTPRVPPSRLPQTGAASSPALPCQPPRLDHAGPIARVRPCWSTMLPCRSTSDAHARLLTPRRSSPAAHAPGSAPTAQHRRCAPPDRATPPCNSAPAHPFRAPLLLIRILAIPHPRPPPPVPPQPPNSRSRARSRTARTDASARVGPCDAHCARPLGQATRFPFIAILHVIILQYANGHGCFFLIACCHVCPACVGYAQRHQPRRRSCRNPQKRLLNCSVR